ncbi:hypothetical protein Tco_0153324 [Tanacetum coccineum]
MTRLETFRIKSMWGNYNFDFACSMAHGRSGGLISMWDPNSFIKDDILCDDAFIIVKGHWRNTVGDCYMINIYGPQDSLAKAILWNRITDFMHQHAEVAEALPYVRITTIDHWWSDHNPILLHVSKSNFGPTPFKLFHSWLLRDSFDESIEDKIKAGSANDDDLNSRIKLLQKVDRLNTFEFFDLFQKARIKWDVEDHDLNVDFPPFANSSGLCALDRDSLETPISLDEVKNAVWDCDSSKSLGLDGFSFAFVKKYWNDIKVNILEYVNIFLDIVLLGACSYMLRHSCDLDGILLKILNLCHLLIMPSCDLVSFGPTCLYVPSS